MTRYEYQLPEHPVEYGVEVAVHDLRIDAQAQRSLNEERAQAMADQLVWEAIGSLVVSQRANSERYIVDGMHRHRAAALRGIETLVAEIHYGLDQQEEAVLFLLKNRENTKPKPLDEYKVGLTANLPLYMDTDKVLRAHELSIGSTSNNSIGAVASVVAITEKYGDDILDRVLTVAEEAWGRVPDTWDGMLLGGLAMFLGRHGNVVNDRELVRKLVKAGPAGKWVGAIHSVSTGGGLHGSGTGSRITTCYSLIVKEWNKNKRKNRII